MQIINFNVLKENYCKRVSASALRLLNQLVIIVVRGHKLQTLTFDAI